MRLTAELRGGHVVRHFGRRAQRLSGREEGEGLFSIAIARAYSTRYMRFCST